MSTLKHFKATNTKMGYGSPGIVFGHIFSLVKKGDKIVIMDECDGYYEAELSQDETVAMLNEAIQWVTEKSDK